MKIIQSNTLSEDQERQIRELERMCRDVDTTQAVLFLSNEINFNRDIPVFFSAFEDDSLIGFLTIFIPTVQEAEISAVVHPSHRKSGVFTELDRAAKRVITENGIGRILYCVEPQSKSAVAVLAKRGITELARSEYRMRANVHALRCADSIASFDGTFTVKRTTPGNIADFTKISDKEYGEESSEYLNTITTSDTRTGYILYINDVPTGVFVIGFEDSEPFVYGVAVDKKERGKGYGKLLMVQACKIGARYADTLQLDVDSDNPVAFNLYRGLGFEITFEVDYYIGTQA